MANRNSRKGRPKGLSVVRASEERALREFLASNAGFMLPMIDLIVGSKRALDTLLEQVGVSMVEALLVVSAEQLAGPKRQGKRDGRSGDVGWHGNQPGSVTLSNRKLRVRKPRLRRRGAQGSEIEVPVYSAMRSDAELGARMHEIMMRGVSTRDYSRILPEMASAVGVSKSSVSRRSIKASEEALEALLARRFDAVDILVVYIDGIVFPGDNHVVVAVGVDAEGSKHVLGLRGGASENQTVVKELLTDLVERGLSATRRRLFVIDGSKALRSAITAVFGSDAPVQRCRAHKIRNVTDHLPEHLKDQVKATMRAAYKLDAKEGISRLKKQAKWLEKEHPDAAASLLEGLDETFTINRLGLTPSLMRVLGTTNIIENPNGTARRRTNRVSNWRDGEMVRRWAASSFLDAEKRFRKLMGYKDLWILEASLTGKSSRREEIGNTRAAGVA